LEATIAASKKIIANSEEVIVTFKASLCSGPNSSGKKEDFLFRNLSPSYKRWPN